MSTPNLNYLKILSKNICGPLRVKVKFAFHRNRIMYQTNLNMKVVCTKTLLNTKIFHR